MKALPIGETERIRRLAIQYGGLRWIPIHEFLRRHADRSLIWCRCNHPGCLNYRPQIAVQREQFRMLDTAVFSLDSLPAQQTGWA